MIYITFHQQKDGRFSTGTAGHKYKHCPNLKNRTGIIRVGKPISTILPKCHWCYEFYRK